MILSQFAMGILVRKRLHTETVHSLKLKQCMGVSSSWCLTNLEPEKLPDILQIISNGQTMACA